MGTFGQRLKREREMRGIGLEEISSTTKIGIRMLRALEDERFDLLPGGIFNKGFVRAYAKHVGIDEEQAVADFLVATGEVPAPAAAEPEPEARPAPSAASRWLIAAAVVVVLALAAFGVWKWFAGRAAESPRGAVLNHAAAARAQPASAPAAGSKGRAPPGSAQPSGDANAAQAEVFTVRIRSLRDCWVLVIADGQREEWTLPAEGERTIRARQRVVLKVGNAGGVEISFNGQVLEPLGSENQARTVTFTAQGPRVGPPEPPELQP